MSFYRQMFSMNTMDGTCNKKESIKENMSTENIYLHSEGDFQNLSDIVSKKCSINGFILKSFLLDEASLIINNFE